jgi:hypothetical protein
MRHAFSNVLTPLLAYWNENSDFLNPFVGALLETRITSVQSTVVN